MFGPRGFSSWRRGCTKHPTYREAFQTGLDGARECAERIRSRIALSDGIGNDTRRQLTVSCGVTQLRQNASPQVPLQRADAALYQAKTAGRNRVECD